MDTKIHQEVLAGLSAGVLTTLATHPLDLIKIRLQLQHQNVFSELISAGPGRPALLRNLYRGVGTNLLGNSLAWSIYFGSYNHFKHAVHSLNNEHDLTIKFKNSNLQSYEYAACALLSGMITTVLTNPVWVIKTRLLSSNGTERGSYRNFTDGVRQILAHDGVGGFFRGLNPSLLNVCQGSLQFTIYDTLKYQILDEDAKGSLQNYQYIMVSVVSKTIANFCFYPLQFLKTNLQRYTQGGSPTSSFQIIKNVYLSQGIPGFYKGFVPNILRVLPSTCITFTVYENIKKL